MLVGNDIIDLLSTPPHPKFYDRITSLKEKEIFEKGNITALKLWAAKEAGYKALYQKNPCITGIPRRFEVAKGYSEVRCGEQATQIRLTVTDQFILAEAYQSPSTARSEILLISGGDQSASARTAAKTLLEKEPFNLNCDEFEVIKFGKVPRVVTKNGCEYPISLSHHGRFAAATVLI